MANRATLIFGCLWSARGNRKVSVKSCSKRTRSHAACLKRDVVGSLSTGQDKTWSRQHQFSAHGRYTMSDIQHR